MSMLIKKELYIDLLFSNGNFAMTILFQFIRNDREKCHKESSILSKTKVKYLNKRYVNNVK